MCEMQEGIGSDHDEAERGDEPETEQHVRFAGTDVLRSVCSAIGGLSSCSRAREANADPSSLPCRVGRCHCFHPTGHRLHLWEYERLSRYQATWSSARESR